MKRRDAETPREDRFTGKIIGAAIEIHRALRPGLLESAYQECLCYELSQRELEFHVIVELRSGRKRIVNHFSENSASRRLGVEKTDSDATLS